MADLIAAGRFRIVRLPRRPVTGTMQALSEPPPPAPEKPKSKIAVVKLIDIAGLYKPGYDDPLDVQNRTTRLSGYVKGERGRPGYKSEDHRGRIFINHVPRKDATVEWDKLWKKNTQYIELTVEIYPEDFEVPPGLRVVWSWEDPDDPFNENTDVHPDAGAFLDPNDYDDQGGKLEAKEGDNEGECDFPNPDSGEEAQFETIAPYGRRAGSAKNEVETDIVDRLSKIRFHVTNVGGDNFRIKVRLTPHGEISHSFGDETGVMTMWKRISVEVRKMTTAADLPIENVPPYFENAFVQMDFMPVQPAPQKAHICNRVDDESDASSRYMEKEFKNKNKPGWFFLVSAVEAAKEVATSHRELLYQGDGEIKPFFHWGQWFDIIVIPQHLPKTAASIRLKEGNDSIDWFSMGQMNATPGPGFCTLFPASIDFNSDFEAGDGWIGDHERGGRGGIYDRFDVRFPSHTISYPGRNRRLDGYGFPLSPAKVEVEVYTAGGGGTGGISTFVRKGGKDYFAGRTMIFSRNRAYLFQVWPMSTTILESTIVHEFTHAFGFPHKCGFHTYQDPAKYSCAMNYFHSWLYAPGTRTLQRFVAGEENGHLCAAHLNGLRTVHLEDNPALWEWK